MKNKNNNTVSEYIQVPFFGRTYLLRACKRKSRIYEQPNFGNTRKALAGVLKQEETIEEWEERVAAHKRKVEKEIAIELRLTQKAAKEGE